MQIDDFPVLTFDTYGTLIDWETGIWNALGPLHARRQDPLEREAGLAAFARVEAAQEAETPTMLYSDLLTAAHDRLAREWGLEPDAQENTRFGHSVGDWPAFPDATEALAFLKRNHRLITLTNCDQASYRGSDRRLGQPWDAIWTAEDVGSYKPSPANFTFLIERVAADFGAAASDILHVAQSLYHDHVPAKAAGLTTVWIDRRAGKTGGATPAAAAVEPDLRFGSMAEFAAWAGREPAEG